ncbi:MAG: MFS transporter [Fibrobacter sp.]|nr:MFS transporter [Fibrobacter sp.]
MIQKSKKLFYLVEGLNSFAVVYYTNYIFFFMKHEFGFGDFENLLLAALNGFVYAIGSWQGGKFAQKFGNVKSIAIGICGIITALLFGLLFNKLPVQLFAYIVYTFSVCMIWPALEAIVSDESDGCTLSTMVGVYNVTWAGASAIAYFVTGYLLETLGMKSIYWLPVLIHACQLGVILPLAVRARKKEKVRIIKVVEITTKDHAPPLYAKRFLHMAWVANPFSYIAISTMLPLIPSISHKLGLSTTLAGITCSIWMFARLITFVTLWKWNGWHYRFRWLAGSFVTLAAGYTGMLLAENVMQLIAAQMLFGVSTGVIYYSSLYYSMHGSEEKGKHGGLHEAMIGCGLFTGPAFGAVCIFLVPSTQNSGLPVSALLITGLCAIGWMGRFRVKSKK